MKQCIIAVILALAICISARPQTTQIIEEYHIPIFSVKTYMGDTSLVHLVLNAGVVANTFDSLLHAGLRPGNSYDMVFQKVRCSDSLGVFQRTCLLFKEVVIQELPVINGCTYQISCFTSYSMRTKPYLILGNLEQDSLIRDYVYSYFFNKPLEYGMRYTLTIIDSVFASTGDRSVYEVSFVKDHYIQTIKK